MQTRAVVTVDLDAIVHNCRILKAATHGSVMAVVKADGYGHGAVPVARAALAGGADALGVAFPFEGLALRAAGIQAPILAWLWVPGEEISHAARERVTLGVSSLAQLDQVARAGVPGAAVHLKLDTGLGRGGAAKSDWAGLCRAAAQAQRSGAVQVQGVMSHLANAEIIDDPSVAGQIQHYLDGLDIAADAGLTELVRHLGNSAAALGLPKTHFDMVRCGIAVYGLDPVDLVGRRDRHGLRPAMQLSAQVALAKRVPAGHGVSYGLTYRTATETTLALIPVGYGDGIPRSAGGAATVSVGQRRYPVVGRIAMDQMVIDVGDDVVLAGDRAEIFGSGADGEPTALDWAQAADTIDYEIVTRIGARVPRQYQGGPA